MAVANGMNYAYNLVMARLLGPSGYGALGALLALVVIGTVPGYALQAVVARHTALRASPPEARQTSPPVARQATLPGPRQTPLPEARQAPLPEAHQTPLPEARKTDPPGRGTGADGQAGRGRPAQLPVARGQQPGSSPGPGAPRGPTPPTRRDDIGTTFSTAERSLGCRGSVRQATRAAGR